METVTVGGVDVGLSIVPMRRSVSGMPVVVTCVSQLSDARAAFGIFPVGSHRVQIIGRCDHAPLDIGAVLKRLGGGGNADAGSATLRGVSGEEARDQLVRALEEQARSGSGTGTA
jgi:nanoRNase/pAp phosphatase (c-di-AMP/oligoRNAs hydrolase)